MPIGPPTFLRHRQDIGRNRRPIGAARGRIGVAGEESTCGEQSPFLNELPRYAPNRMHGERRS